MTFLLCIVAHPDDETMLCGGTLAALTARGVTVDVLCATRGEGGEMGEPPRATRQALGQAREAEMRCACRALGVRQLDFMDYVDPLVGPEDALFPFAEDEDELCEAVLAHLRRRQPDAVLTHGRDGEYGHPGHQLLHRATWAAFRRWQAAAPEAACAVCFYTFAAAVPGLDDRIFNVSEPADVVLDLAGTPWLDAKEAAALCHVTQHALFKRRRKARTVREILRRVESLHRYWPPDGPEIAALADFVDF